MSKRVSLQEAIRGILPGQRVAMGGMLTYRRPMALTAEILRQRIQGLTVMGWTLGIETELLLCEPGIVDTIQTAYMGLDLFGLGPAYRKAVESGRVSVIEETESTFGFGLRAALQGVDYMPARSLLGTDILKVRPDIQVVKSPYSSGAYPAIPPVVPDVALIHVPLADEFGNAVIETNYGVDAELSLLAPYTVVSAEMVVPVGDARLRGTTRILGHSVNAVVECPGGAWPTSCYPNYAIDVLAIVDYVQAWLDGEQAVTQVIEGWMREVSTC